MHNRRGCDPLRRLQLLENVTFAQLLLRQSFTGMCHTHVRGCAVTTPVLAANTRAVGQMHWQVDKNNPLYAQLKFRGTPLR